MTHISIVTPVYNSEKYISQTILSVQGQSYPNWELLLIDDGSIDQSKEIIRSFMATDNRIRLIENVTNSGPAVSRNRGISEATGKYLTFLDADDIWLPDFLDTSINFLIKNGYKFVFASYKRADEDLNPLYEDFIVPEKVNYRSLLKTCPISCLTAFLDIGTIGKHYMPLIDKRQDYCLWLSILKKDVDYAYGIQHPPLAIYRIRKGSVSRNKLKAAIYMWKVYRKIEKLNFFYSTYLLCWYTYNGFKKYSNKINTARDKV